MNAQQMMSHDSGNMMMNKEMMQGKCMSCMNDQGCMSMTCPMCPEKMNAKKCMEMDCNGQKMKCCGCCCDEKNCDMKCSMMDTNMGMMDKGNMEGQCQNCMMENDCMQMTCPMCPEKMDAKKCMEMDCSGKMKKCCACCCEPGKCDMKC
uniref:Uncharacterized protein n=1 Tax=Acrobeloides nanus TaxID=290746 RepID=A0A914CK40_9BILA